MKKIYFYKFKEYKDIYMISTGLKYDRLMYQNNIQEITIEKNRAHFERASLNNQRLIILDIYEILFNNEYMEQLTFLIESLFKIIDDNLRYSQKPKLWRYNIKKESEAKKIYIQLIKDLYKQYKNILLEKELGEFYERVKNL